MTRVFGDSKRKPINCQCGQAADVYVVGARNGHYIYNVKCDGLEDECWRGPQVAGKDAAIDVWDETMRAIKTKELLDEFQAEKVRLDMILIDLGERNEP